MGEGVPRWRAEFFGRKVASRLQISRESVRRCLKEKGLKPVQTKSKPKLSEKNITARIEFAETHRNTDWSKVMFTDEKDFWLFSRVSKKNDVVWVADDSSIPLLPTFLVPP